MNDQKILIYQKKKNHQNKNDQKNFNIPTDDMVRQLTAHPNLPAPHERSICKFVW